MKNIGVFLSENFKFLDVNFSMYLNRRVFVINDYLHDNFIFLFLHENVL